MLARVVAAAVVALLGLLIAPVPSALADGDGQCTQQVDPETGQVRWVCEDEGGTGETSHATGSVGDSSTCSFAGTDIPCTGPEGSTWNGSCYVGAPVPDQPQTGPNGETIPEEGQYHYCYLGAGQEGPGRAWVPVGQPQLQVNPVTLANRAIAAMDLDPIAIGIVPESGPDRVGLVGLPVWMWVDNAAAQTFGPITASAAEGSVSVSATASVSSIVWDMGDGAAVPCKGEGTPYADQYGKQDSPTCGHRYQKMSTDQPDGVYQVTATSHWIVEWTGGGQSGTIEFDLTTDPLPIRIGEAQVLTQ